MMMPSKDSNWVSIAEQVTVETDSAKLAILLGRLCSALNDRKRAALPLTSKSQS
jgi:hypothetical protein